MQTTLRVNLGERSYDLFFGTGVLDRLATEIGEWRTSGRKVAIVTDERVAFAQSAVLATLAAGGAPTLVLPPGEGTKSTGQLARIWDFLAEHRLDRSSRLIALGGGVIGDLAGFAAASYLRGLPFVQVPTTLLAMVDSSVGGKTGINLGAGKNLVGAFHQPAAVYLEPAMLATLPTREFAAGMAEVLKYGLLADAALWARLEREPLTLAAPDFADVLHRCCEIKARIVEADERETAAEGGRALLNLGHTFGHAIEQVTGYGAYLHGEAVAIGLAAAARLSCALGDLKASDVARVERTVVAHGLPVQLRAPLPWDALLAAMARDKKVRAGGLRFVVLRSLGEAATQGGIDTTLVERVFREVGAT